MKAAERNGWLLEVARTREGVLSYSAWVICTNRFVVGFARGHSEEAAIIHAITDARNHYRALEAPILALKEEYLKSRERERIAASVPPGVLDLDALAQLDALEDKS